MKVIRLFVNSNLDSLVRWQLIDGEIEVSNGESTFAEIAEFDSANIEVYLSSDCCSIFEISTSGLSSRRLTEELIIGLIEDNLIDAIDEVKPIILRVEDNIAYVAVFSDHFYATLLNNLDNLNKPIRFIEPYAYATIFKENSWTVFLSAKEQFLRTDLYRYYLLDNNKPVPTLLQDMLDATQTKPESLIVYTDNEDLFTKFKEAVALNAVTTNEHNFGHPVWNFYNQKSTSFHIKLNQNTKTQLFKVFSLAKYVLAFLIIFWLCDIASLKIHTAFIQSKTSKLLSKSLHNSSITSSTINNLQEKITIEKHQHGLYAETDALILFRKFLEVIPEVGQTEITQIDYHNSQLQIFINNDFNTKEFNNYANILALENITATLDDYKDYSKAHKQMAKNDNNNLDQDNTETIAPNTEWVITLKYSLAR